MQSKQTLNILKLFRKFLRQYLRCKMLTQISHQRSPRMSIVLALQTVQGRQQHQSFLVIDLPNHTLSFLKTQLTQRPRPMMAVKNLVSRFRIITTTPQHSYNQRRIAAGVFNVAAKFRKQPLGHHIAVKLMRFKTVKRQRHHVHNPNPLSTRQDHQRLSFR